MRASLRSRSAGVSGLIVPDMPAAEAGELRAACDAAGIALVPLVAPTTPPDEVRRIAEAARGFVYVVSVTGVTGERAALPPELSEVVERVRAAADVPVAVGFGVGTPEQVGQVGRDRRRRDRRQPAGAGDRRCPPRSRPGWKTCAHSWATARPLSASPVGRLPRPMFVFLGFTAGMCLFVVLWATGLAQDAAGIAGLAILGVGVLAQMADSRSKKASP